MILHVNVIRCLHIVKHAHGSYVLKFEASQVSAKHALGGQVRMVQGSDWDWD